MNTQVIPRLATPTSAPDLPQKVIPLYTLCYDMIGSSIKKIFPRLAILYLFYKELKVTENHLKFLKQYNRGVPIFGLFGGVRKEASIFEKRLGNHLDDFYIAPESSSEWKWYHEDLMILDWYEKRGKGFPWESIAIVEWDTLVFEKLEKTFPHLQKDEIFISGVRNISPFLERKWCWTMPRSYKKGARKTYTDFIRHLRTKFHYTKSILCCQFAFAIFSRTFLEKLLFLKPYLRKYFHEYTLPTYARVFKTPLYDKNLGVRWFQHHNNLPLNAYPAPIAESFIRQELKKRTGWRIFHPYRTIWK